MICCGIDVGTQGARCVLVDDTGEVRGQGQSPFSEPAAPGLQEGWFEQEPAQWINALRKAAAGALAELAGSGRDVTELAALSVTSTSGTLCPVAADGRPVGRAIMYSDSRSAAQAERTQDAGRAVAQELGYRFGSSYGLPKILWLKENEPERFGRARFLISPTDFVIGWLTGSWGRTDQTNALKFGYDLLAESWPAYISAGLGIALEKLPRVQTTGQPAGRLLPERAADLGAPVGIPVAAGLTDGCASQISSGAVAPGDYNTTIGTTLVVKGVSRKLLVDPLGRLYCHRHPEGYWLPGGASNTGAECLARRFDDDQVRELSARAADFTPTSLVAYPLVGRGERFPFRSEQAEAFTIGTASCDAELFAAYMEGVACLERMALDMIEQELGGEIGDRIYSAGGGAASDTWLQVRADTLGRAVLRPAAAGGAMGAAIVAATLALGEPLTAVASRMVRMDREVHPRRDKLAAYEQKYGQFVAQCRNRGYL